jgi:hypothetical protein
MMSYYKKYDVRLVLKKHGYDRFVQCVLLMVLALYAVLSGGCSKETLTGSDRPTRPNLADPTPPAGPDPNSGLNVRTMAAAATSYAITYGALNPAVIETLKTYPLVIIHPYNGDITRSEVFQIKQGVNPDTNADNVVVLCYISVGEDDRTYNLSDAQMLADSRFRGDGSGPSTDPRGAGVKSLKLALEQIKGVPTNGGFASYYLNDNAIRCNDPAKRPDQNPNFQTRFVNAGDPEWYGVVNSMTIDKNSHTPPGLKEMLTTSYGRGLGCDGVFMDTIDTAAPNFYTSCSDTNHSSSEWTAQGFTEFFQHLREEYPEKVILQNRGLFYFDPRQPQFEVFKRGIIDLGFFESYYLGNNSDTVISPFFEDNRYNVAPKIMAEANRPNGFKVLSLGYANGFDAPKAGIDLQTLLLGATGMGYGTLMNDVNFAQEVGFTPYITSASVDFMNSFVKNNDPHTDTTPPVWSSVYNATYDPPLPLAPRVGIQKAVKTSPGTVTLSWDVALDMHRVSYVVYYMPSTSLFDFAKATRVALTSSVGDGYDKVWNNDSPSKALSGVYPYQQTISGLPSGVTYRFVIRAVDSAGNEDSNTAFIEVPL